MLALLKKRIKNQRGFTLVELMAVVVIIGILIAVAIPVYNNIQEGVRQRADEASLRVLNAAAQAWALDNGMKDLTEVSDSDMSVEILQGKNSTDDPKYISDDFNEIPQSNTYKDGGFAWNQDSGTFKLTKK